MDSDYVEKCYVEGCENNAIRCEQIGGGLEIGVCPKHDRNQSLGLQHLSGVFEEDEEVDI